MTERYLSAAPLPFCGGCGHALVVRNTARALARLGIDPLDVVLVTDIGCHGLIDSHFHTHTVHGLHGRSVALAAGIAACLDNKWVITYIGDGGVVIGLQHLIDAAHRNFDMTVIVYNNMLYGMTGGQPSGVTPCGYRTPTCPDGARLRGYDICQRVHSAGAASARRVVGRGDFSDAIADALAVRGFSLVEVLEHCASYGVKHNPGRSLDDIARAAGLDPEASFTNPGTEPFHLVTRAEQPSLLDDRTIDHRYRAGLDHRISILLGGSAGEGVQIAADLFVRAAIASGLAAARKGAYPVTVGVGYSVAEIILSPEPILHAGYIIPDAAVITSADGLRYFGPAIAGMESGSVLLDASLPVPATGATVTTADIRDTAGARSAAVCALLLFLHQNNIFPADAFISEIDKSKLAGKVDIERISAAVKTARTHTNRRV
jgi:pyruvate/2-oxoacid:ferredoxin oxidoreductase beta subunit/Pyruvate/2-oxoacid:ferredoxin oxidoreductase gamma subunit